MFFNFKQHMLVAQTDCEDAGTEFSEILAKLVDFHKSFCQKQFDDVTLNQQMRTLGFYLGVGKINSVNVVDASGQAEITFHPLQIDDLNAAVAANDNKDFEVIQAIVC